VIESVHPFEDGDLDGFERPQQATPMNDLGPEQSDDRLGERMFVRVTDAAEGGFDTCLGEALGVADADVLRPQVGMAD